jgi:phosphoribosylanthranilate isomerase
MRIKVCGMTVLDQVAKLEEMGVDFAGFIFYPRSPRFVMKHIKGMELKKWKGPINKVGVFVNATFDEVMNHVENFGLHMVQLHGDESPRLCDKLSGYLPVIKVFRVRPTDNIAWKIREYPEMCDLYLFDTDAAGFGGSGQQFDWHLLDNVAFGKPFILSGGIGPDDVDRVKDFASGPRKEELFAIDVNSKFENAPGEKDLEALKSFVTKLKG